MLAPGWETPQGIPTRGFANPPLSRNRGAVALSHCAVHDDIRLTRYGTTAPRLYGGGGILPWVAPEEL